MELLDKDSFNSLLSCTSPYSAEHNAQLLNSKRGEASFTEPRLVQDDTTSSKFLGRALIRYNLAHLNSWKDQDQGLVAVAASLASLSIECQVLACRFGIPLDAVKEAVVACELNDVQDNRPAVATAIFGTA